MESGLSTVTKLSGPTSALRVKVKSFCSESEEVTYGTMIYGVAAASFDDVDDDVDDDVVEVIDAVDVKGPGLKCS